MASRGSQPPNFTTVDIETNSVVLNLPSNFRYYQYDDFVALGPNARSPSSKKKSLAFHHLQNTVAGQIFRNRMIYDRQKMAYCRQPLDFGGSQARSFIIHLGQSQEVSPQTRGAYQITIGATGESVDANNIKDLLAPGTPRELLAPSPPPSRVRGELAKNVIQLIMLQGPHTRYSTTTKKAYFFGTGREDVRPLKKGIELWRGIFLSVRPAINNLIVTFDTTAAAVYSGGPLIELCLQFLELREVHRLQLSPNDARLKALEKFVSRLRVAVTIGNKKYPAKMIRRLEAQGAGYTFSKDGVDTTVAAHFRDAYNIMLRFPKIIAVSFEKRGSDKENVVPLELCSIEPGQICNKLPDDLRTDMVRFSTMDPQSRRQRIKKEIDAFIQSEYIAESGMAINPQLISVQGKLLRTPTVVYGRQSKIEPTQGKWNVVRQTLVDPVPLDSWAVLNMCSQNVTNAMCESFMNQLMECCHALGMAPKRPYFFQNGHPHNVDGDFTAVLKSVTQMAVEHKKEINPRKFILIVLLGQEAGPTRTEIKHLGDVKYGVMTQCLRQGKFAKSGDNSQYWNNVALKLNARLGGTNSYATSPFWTELQQRCGPYMIMGADVGHPSPGTQRPSVTSLVYSDNIHGTRYTALTGIQAPRQEFISNLKADAMKAIKDFLRVPDRTLRSIFFFRDGVSEGEYHTVAAEERKQLEAAIADTWAEKGFPPESRPRITYIVVTKRHHTVLLPTNLRRDQIVNKNCPPGVVVDTGITNPAHPNFYLQSHAAIQGTSRSSHYIVLQDENFGFNLEVIQQFAYLLCHVYSKATRVVSIPAPVYYADLVCSRLMFHLDPTRIPSDDGASSASDENTFDLSRWQQAFSNVNQFVSKNMYFL